MEHLNYNPLSLKDMTIRRVVAVLFKESDILESIGNFRRKYLFNDGANLKVWRERVEDKMSDKISKFVLPKSLTKQLIDTFKPMGQQVARWKAFHEGYLLDTNECSHLHFNVPILEKLCWTAAGTVDYPKTAEELVCSDVIDNVKRYKLACLYCLEDYIPQLWQELPNNKKKAFLCNEKYPLQMERLGLQSWWPYIIQGEESKLDNLTKSYRRDQLTFHQYAFQYSAAKGNKNAAEYFFQKLTYEEKEASLIRTTRAVLASRNAIGNYDYGKFPKEKVSEMFRSLLSVITPDQKMRIFEEQPEEVLECFLHWPLQDQFSEIADLIWDFIDEGEYDSLLLEMYESFLNSGHYFQTLFQEFFLRIPCDFRKNFVDQQLETDSYLENILGLEDIEGLEITFRSVDAATREGLVFSELVIQYFEIFISGGRWDIVEVILREARLSKEDRERLKEVFTRYLTSIGVGEMKLKTPKWARFFKYLDETNAPSKKCLEDQTPTEAKKIKLSGEE
ncbi:hypothetical protein AVEN_40445-1 [Araneus ventricosus]|uniref:Uncharacterized protein n=3 Tax=Araneus ventricosus TaxID=182803 RepID=A0A4Y2ABC6_ARAVE|nr:hypothetical protein AVEN_261731-1 [Araneus ventricosus]GBL76264.1 hypothetical protein AVEN_40445-1 [Araneus ventricosus]